MAVERVYGMWSGLMALLGRRGIAPATSRCRPIRSGDQPAGERVVKCAVASSGHRYRQQPSGYQFSLAARMGRFKRLTSPVAAPTLLTPTVGLSAGGVVVDVRTGSLIHFSLS